MNQLFNIENPFWQKIGKLVECVFASMLWLLFSLPIITIGAASTALYTTIYKHIQNEKGYLWQTFWTAWKENWKRSTIIWLIALTLQIILAVDIWIFRSLELHGNPFGKIYWLMLAVFCFAVTWIVYLIGYASRFEGSVKEVLIISFLLLVLHPIKAVIVFLNVLGGIAFIIMWPYLILILPAVIFWLCSLTLEKVFLLHMRQEDIEKIKTENNSSSR